MASPRRTPAAGSGDKENICQERDGVSDCPTLRQVGAVSTKRKKKPGGFNLRKSIAWNPAFFTEEGVLDNVELSMLSGSELKANGSPSSGCGGTISPSCRFGKSGNTSVLKEVAENSRGKFPAKFRTIENKGRKLFSSAKTSERDEREELAGTQDKRSARSIQKCIPRLPAGYTQKKVPNSSATAQVSRTPKKSQPSLPMIPRSTSSVTNISKSNIKLAPVKTEHTRRVEGLPPKSKIKPASLTKSSGPNVEKDVIKGSRDVVAGKAAIAANDIAQENQAVKRQKLDDGRTRQAIVYSKKAFLGHLPHCCQWSERPTVALMYKEESVL